MNKYQLAEWLHDNYEMVAKEKNWATQESCKVEFWDLPEENRQTMVSLADKMLSAFKIISSKQPVSGHLPTKALARLVELEKEINMHGNQFDEWKEGQGFKKGAIWAIERLLGGNFR